MSINRKCHTNTQRYDRKNHCHASQKIVATKKYVYSEFPFENQQAEYINLATKSQHMLRNINTIVTEQLRETNHMKIKSRIKNATKNMMAKSEKV